MQQQKPIQYSENDIRDYLINYEDKPSLAQFAYTKLDYNGENGSDDNSITNWIAQHVTSFVNYESNRGSKLFEEYEFVSVLTTMYDEYYNHYDKVFQDRIDHGFYKYNPVSDVFIFNNIATKIHNNKYKPIVEEEFNKFDDAYFITKDKNVFINNFDTIVDKVPAIKEQYNNIHNQLQTNFNNKQPITIKLDANENSCIFSINALINILENYLETAPVTDKYVYRFFIEDRWKSYTLKSKEEWDRLLDTLKNGSLIFNLDNLQQLYWTDGFYNQADTVLPDLSIIQHIQIRPVMTNHERGDNSGEFFQYTIKEQYSALEPLLSKAQIFVSIKMGDTHRPEFDKNCFCYALQQAANDRNNLKTDRPIWNIMFEQICKDCIGRNVSTRDIKNIAEKYGLYVYLTSFSKIDQKRNRANNQFGDINKARLVCNLGIFKQKTNINHFFYNCQVPVSNYFTQHIDDILKYGKDHNKPIEWLYRVTRQKTNCYISDKSKFKPIDMIDFIYKLFDQNVFKELTQNDTADLKSDLHYYTKDSIESLEYFDANIKKIKYEEPKIDEDKIIEYFYADFEADPTSKNHTPFCCSFCKRNDITNMKTLYGLNCAEDLLNQLPDNSITYFHNFGYDGRFLAKYGVRKAINKGSKIMNMNITYNGKKLKFKDSYSMLAKPLKDFPEMFKNVIDNKKIQKELFPYKYYSINRVLSNVGTISEAGIEERPQWDKDQYKQFNDNIDKINGCRIDDNHFNMEKYCKFYCEQDVKILALGHTEFRRLTLLKPIELDIDQYISAPALANAFFTKNVYTKVPQLKQYSGIPREFIQKGVYGGRCMTNSNKKHHITKPLADFDACSLYPSGMNRLYLPTGAPQICTDEMLQGSYLIDHVLAEYELQTTDEKPISAFFVEIEITKVGNDKRQFPLICKRTKKGNSNVNECCTMYVDNIALEDLIKYQAIEYKINRGYYWTGCKSPVLTKVIRQIYDARVQYKKEGNPIQEVLKLIMNSAYGKTIQKPINNDFIYRDNYIDKHGTSKADRFLSKNFHKIVEYFDISSDITAFKVVRGIDDHYVPNFIGVQILSMSKRIMNEVMCTAEDIGIKIYYQDTDSMHIENDSLNDLAKEFKKRYNRELIGTDMGQFHSDFAHKDRGKNIVSIESYFLGKKAYCDNFINENNQIDYHLRMKGIPTKSLELYSKDFNNDPLQMYKYLFEGMSINFNILDVKPSFEMKNDMTISSRQKFTRKIKF